jgi:hypothetical protein
MNWKNPVEVKRYNRLKMRERAARCRAEGLCVQCRAPVQTRGICDDCKAQRREKYHLMTKPQLAIGAKKCLDCRRMCLRATSVRCQRCQCRRAAQMRWTKGQAA